MTDPIAKLRRAGESLDPDLHAELLALGPELIPRLIALLADTHIGWGRCHAVDILMDLRVEGAIRPMLDAVSACLDDFSEEEFQHDDLVSLHIERRLAELGADVVEPVLAFLADSEGNLGALYAACQILVDVDVKDDRIFHAIVRAWDEDDDIGTTLFLKYGDERAVPVIERAIFEQWPDSSRRSDLIALLMAHKELGGVLPAGMREVADRWVAEWKAHRWIAESATKPSDLN